MRIEIICTGDEVLTGKIVNTNFSYMTQKLEDFGLSVRWGTTVGDDREELLAAFRLSGRARRCGHRQWRAGTDGRRSLAGDRRARRRRRARPQRGLAAAHGGFLPPAQPRHVGEQPQAGDAADDRGDPRQPDRHRLRLCARHRQGALLLYARRAARAAPHARRADHPAPAGARRRADGDPPQALPFLWARRVACRPAARPGSRSWCPTAASSSAFALTTRRSRRSSPCAAPIWPRSTGSWLRSRPKCASGSAISSSPRTIRRSRASC